MNRKSLTILTLALTAILLTGPVTAADAPALVYGSSSGLSFEAQVANAGSVLTVSGPQGIHIRQSFTAGEPAFFSIFDDLGVLPDGHYTYSLTMTPKIDSATRTLMDEARATGDDSIVQTLRAQGKIPAEALATSGSFTIAGGAVVSDALEEEAGGLRAQSSGAATPGGLTNVNGAAQVFATDVIVQGSECVGFDCVSSESFGFDTLRLKENNLRLHFNDTSSSASFPSNDWRITANDSSNGGGNYLAIGDATAGTTPFRVDAGAGNNAMRIESGGNVGIGTSNPAVEVHLTDGDSPTYRLEQDGSSGFTPQTWDLAGNETNFFIRDVTNGSKLPFRIRPSAPDSSIDIQSDGDVGMGTASPSADLHVRGTDGATDFLVEEASSTELARVLATLKNNGRTLLLFEDTSADGEIWRFRSAENTFTIDSDGAAGNELTINAANGNVTILGILNENSNREAKTNIVAVNTNDVLARVAALPLATWNYKKDLETEHLGPMAQDFYAAFGLGETNTGLSTYDTAGVALAAIQALHKQNQELMKRLAVLEAQIAD